MRICALLRRSWDGLVASEFGTCFALVVLSEHVGAGLFRCVIYSPFRGLPGCLCAASIFGYPRLSADLMSGHLGIQKSEMRLETGSNPIFHHLESNWGIGGAIRG